jgi:hypothetical protein
MERWGEFLLHDDLSAIDTTPEALGPRADFEWLEGEGPWNHHLGRTYSDSSGAQADPYVPIPAWAPPEESFLAASVLADGQGASESLIAFIRQGNSDVETYKRPFNAAPTGDDRTLMVMWSLRYSRPFYMQDTGVPQPINSRSIEGATVVQDALVKVTVRGIPAILRRWSPGRGQNMYGARLPTLILNWYEGARLWSAQSTFLGEAELIRVAESSRVPPP